MKVETFPYSIEVVVDTAVNNSEDEGKVREAVLNVFPKMEMVSSRGKLMGVSSDVESLHTIYEQIRIRRTLGAVRRLLLSHSSNNSTWLYFNKQAAYAKVVAVCDESTESPLGPIKMSATSVELDEFINWLAPRF